MRRVTTSSSTVAVVPSNYTGRAARRSNQATLRRLACAFAVLTSAVAISVAPALAQAPAKTPPDSLAARLERAEEQIALLQQQLADLAESGVKARSRVEFELHGSAIINAYTNSTRVFMVDVPIVVQPDPNDGLPRGSVGIAIRQSALGFAVSAPNVLGADFFGDLDVDFFGGQAISNTTPVLRLRTMRATLKWNHAELMVGQDVPLMSLLNPLTLAAPALTGFSGSGNLWAWLPQVRFGVERGTGLKFGLAGAVLAPNSTGSAAGSASDADVAQRSGRPFVEARAHVGWGSGDLAADVGLGTHAGWYAVPNSTAKLRSTGVGVDARIPLTAQLEVRGEWFSGAGMQGLGGGAISQLFDTRGQLIHGTGMWGQLNFKPSTRVVVGSGIGIDDPDDTNMAPTARLKNVVSEAHVHLRPAGPLLLGLEYRRMTTTYAAGRYSNDHLNLTAGFEF